MVKVRYKLNLKESKMAFSKQNLISDLETIAGNLQRRHNFTCETGYSQVDGKGESINRDYAEWDRVRIIIDSIKSGYVGYGELK